MSLARLVIFYRITKQSLKYFGAFESLGRAPLIFPLDSYISGSWITIVHLSIYATNWRVASKIGNPPWREICRSQDASARIRDSPRPLSRPSTASLGAPCVLFPKFSRGQRPHRPTCKIFTFGATLRGQAGSSPIGCV